MSALFTLAEYHNPLAATGLVKRHKGAGLLGLHPPAYIVCMSNAVLMFALATLGGWYLTITCRDEDLILNDRSQDVGSARKCRANRC